MYSRAMRPKSHVSHSAKTQWSKPKSHISLIFLIYLTLPVYCVHTCRSADTEKCTHCNRRYDNGHTEELVQHMSSYDQPAVPVPVPKARVAPPKPVEKRQTTDQSWIQKPSVPPSTFNPVKELENLGHLRNPGVSALSCCDIHTEPLFTKFNLYNNNKNCSKLWTRTTIRHSTSRRCFARPNIDVHL